MADPVAAAAGAKSDIGSPRRRWIARDLLKLFGPYWSCERRTQVRLATLALVLLTLGQVGLTVWGNHWNRALFDALEQRNAAELWWQVAVFGLIFLVSIAVTAAHLMVKRWLQRDWRAWLTDRLLAGWLQQGRQYRLQRMPGEHDNPDQRIAEDIRIATEVAVALAHTLIFSLLILVMFIDILWGVSGSIAVPGTSVQIPGYMVPLAVLYALLGSGLGWLFGRPLVRTTNALQSAEASFRFGLSQAREHAEAIALLHGEQREQDSARRRFRQIVFDWDRQSLAYLGLLAFGTAYGALLPVFPILIAAPQYIAGAMTLGALMQASQAFGNLTSALSWPVNNIGEIARFRASADRVLALHEDLRRLDAHSDGRLQFLPAQPGLLEVQALQVFDGDGSPLCAPVDWQLRAGEQLWIEGEANALARLFDALGGVWTLAHGRLRLPDAEALRWIPRRAFLPDGSLRAALSYPHPVEHYRREQLDAALASLDLQALQARLDSEENWQQSLPSSLQQRLGLVRILLQRPDWLIVDGGPEVLDPEHPQRALQLLAQQLPQAGVILLGAAAEQRPPQARVLRLAAASSTEAVATAAIGEAPG